MLVNLLVENKAEEGFPRKRSLDTNGSVHCLSAHGLLTYSKPFPVTIADTQQESQTHTSELRQAPREEKRQQMLTVPYVALENAMGSR